MKKRIIFTLILLSSITIFSQEEEKPKRNVLGGTINYTQLIYENTTNQLGFPSAQYRETQTNFSVNPYFGIILNNRLLFGLSIGYNRQVNSFPIYNYRENVNIKLNDNLYGVNTFLRFAVNPDNRFQFILIPYVGYSLSNDEQISYSSLNGGPEVIDFENSRYGIGIGTGFLYEINDKYNLILNSGEVSFEIINSKLKGTGQTSRIKSLNANFNLVSFAFGIERKF